VKFGYSCTYWIWIDQWKLTWWNTSIFWKLWIWIDQVNWTRWNTSIPALTGSELSSENWPGEILLIPENYGSVLTSENWAGEIFPFLKTMDQYWPGELDPVKFGHSCTYWIWIEPVNWTRWIMFIPTFTGSVLTSENWAGELQPVNYVYS